MKVRILRTEEFTDLWLMFNEVFEVIENNEGKVTIQPDKNDPLQWTLKPEEYEIVEA